MGAFFITATGTDVGKTTLTSALCYQLKAVNIKTHALKPVMSGVGEDNWQDCDAAQLLKAQGTSVTRDAIRAISPWQFIRPVSPHLMDSPPTLDEVVAFCRKSTPSDATTFIEGVGGVLVPLNNRHTMRDIMEALQLPIILVCGSYVGALSHAFTAIESLNAKGLEIKALVVNESHTSATSVLETVTALRQWTGGNVPIFTMPRITPKTCAWKDMPPMTEIIIP